MDDPVKTGTQDDLPRAAGAPPAPQGGQTLARAPALPWLLFLAALAVAAVLAWKVFRTDDIGDPIATGMVSFEKQDKLTVFSAQLAPVVASDDSRLMGLVKSRQVAVIPARVDYSVDLAQVGRSRMTWNAETHTLSVRLPEISTSKPNLDEAHAQYLREGVWITRDAQDKLTRDNTRLAELQALNQARQPVLMELARAAAKEAVQQNLSIPLKVAGYGDVKVLVTMDGEKTPD